MYAIIFPHSRTKYQIFLGSSSWNCLVLIELEKKRQTFAKTDLY